MDALDRFVSRENITRYRHLASESTGFAERTTIMKLLADEEAKFKLELSGRGDASKERSDVESRKRVGDDRDEQQANG